MGNWKTILLGKGALCAAAICALPHAAHAQLLSVNYDELSILEEPLAFDVGRATVLVKGAVDVPVTLDVDASDFLASANVSFRTQGEVNIEAQLGNRWDVGLTYFGAYDENSDDYNDNVAGYIRTSWGTFAGGNILGHVRELTRRRRGVGNAALALDDYYGQLDRWGGAYIGRFGPSVVGAVVDENGDFAAGLAYQRPQGTHDIKLTANIARSQFVSADGTTNFRSTGGGFGGELTYGSTNFDLASGFENLDANGFSLQRWFISGGAQTKIATLSLSAEGHYGLIEGRSEYSYALGLQQDLARGLSLNLGLNGKYAVVDYRNISVIMEDENTVTASVRYNF